MTGFDMAQWQYDNQQPPDVEDGRDEWDDLDEWEIAEMRLKSRDYEGWANL